MWKVACSVYHINFNLPQSPSLRCEKNTHEMNWKPIQLQCIEQCDYFRWLNRSQMQWHIIADMLTTIVQKPATFTAFEHLWQWLTKWRKSKSRVTLLAEKCFGCMFSIRYFNAPLSMQNAYKSHRFVVCIQCHEESLLTAMEVSSDVVAGMVTVGSAIA